MQPGFVDFGAKSLITASSVHSVSPCIINTRRPYSSAPFLPAITSCRFHGQSVCREKITVAMNEITGNTGIGHRFIAAAIWRWSGLGSSSPIHASTDRQEYTARRPCGLLPLKNEKTGGDRRFFHAEMKICNKEVATITR